MLLMAPPINRPPPQKRTRCRPKRSLRHRWDTCWIGPFRRKWSSPRRTTPMLQYLGMLDRLCFGSISPKSSFKGWSGHSHLIDGLRSSGASRESYRNGDRNDDGEFSTHDIANLDSYHEQACLVRSDKKRDTAYLLRTGVREEVRWDYPADPIITLETIGDGNEGSAHDGKL